MPINPGTLDQTAWTAMRVGFTVERAAANLPQTAATSYFTIAGGRVLAWILGEVTTVIQNQACNTKLIHHPTTGTDMDLCAVLSVANKEVGTLFTITGIPGDAMLGGGQAARFQHPVVLKPGTVQLSTAASNTGATKWTVYYIPIDDGASVAAA